MPINRIAKLNFMRKGLTPGITRNGPKKPIINKNGTMRYNDKYKQKMTGNSQQKPTLDKNGTMGYNDKYTQKIKTIMTQKRKGRGIR